MRDDARDRAHREKPHSLGISRFELLRCLGAGATGTVFEALDASTRARVALKVLHEQTGLALLRFKQEFRVLAELTHPNLVRFGALFEEHGQFYLTMELVEGQGFLDFVRPAPSAAPLRPELSDERLRSRAGHGSGERSIPRSVASRGPQRHPGTLEPERLRSGLTQLASGLMALHAAGLVHRDVKPQNILVTNTGRLVLLDFGLAMSVDEGQSPNVAGTMAYMAPEQAMAQDVQGAADWYAMGVVLYEALTGQLPASHQRFRNLWAEAKGEAPAPAAISPEIPHDLNALCSRLLEFLPEHRPSEEDIARCLGMEVDVERRRSGFRSQVQFKSGIFVAREQELSTLRAAMARASAGAFPIISVEGESGIGKSTLVRQLISELRRDQQVMVLASRCYESQTMRYRGVDGVIDALVRQLHALAVEGEVSPMVEHAEFLAELFPVFRALPGFEGLERPDDFQVDPQHARRKAFQALERMFRIATARGPILIHVDDAQWMDADSIALLASVIGERNGPALLVLSLRPPIGERQAALLQQAADHTRIVLGPLSEHQSRTLIELLLEGYGVRNEVDPETLARTSGGHPLFIQELVSHARRTRKQVSTLDEAIADRLDALDDQAAELLRVIAIAAGPLNNLVARSASGLSPELFPWVLSELRNQNLVSFNSDAMSDSVQTHHDRIRKLIVGQMTSAAQLRAHRDLADAFEKHAPDELEALAHHFAQANDATSAARYAMAAGQRALEKLSFEHAAILFRLALRFEVRPELIRHAQASIGHALAGAGRGSDAADAYLQAAQGERGLAAVDLRRRASEQLLRSGHLERGSQILFAISSEVGLFVPHGDLGSLLSLVVSLLELNLRGLAVAQRRAPISERDELRLKACWTAATGLSMVHHLRATAFQARALLLALAAGDLDRVIKGAALLSATLSNAEGAARKMGDRLRIRAGELAGNNPSDEHRAWLELMRGISAMGEWDFPTCETLCAAAGERFRTRCSGSAWETGVSQAFMLWAATFRGDLRGAARRVPELIADARARGDRHAETALISSPLHLVGLAADEPARVREQCIKTMAEWPSQLACFQHMCGAYVLAQADLYEACAESAWSHTKHAWKMLRKAHLARVQFQRIDLLALRGRAALARAAATRGRERKRWLGKAKDDIRRLRHERAPAALAFADLIHGGLEHLQGDPSSSRSSFDRSLAGFSSLAMQLHAEVSRLAKGIVGHRHEDLYAARRAVLELGVVNPEGMLRLWVPGVVVPREL